MAFSPVPARNSIGQEFIAAAFQSIIVGFVAVFAMAHAVSALGQTPFDAKSLGELKLMRRSQQAFRDLRDQCALETRMGAVPQACYRDLGSGLSMAQLDDWCRRSVATASDLAQLRVAFSYGGLSGKCRSLVKDRIQILEYKASSPTE